ncbi:WD40/YVTN/BNR-like repeat-containing protein [Desulfitobacterium sp.]|uniref:WD40/YVTN/BNR-like repeat-containing protein n=1 Tax=Desulfitobacterium sp. TaxID=49981 RepID=UPI002D0AAC91|nr:YCF48-related protein [Desulfitobacterium sp.]HVJ49080.1 YCF48-related protein [Desulfitobacterium sp.]
MPAQIAKNEFEGSCYFSFISPAQGFLLMGTQPGTGAQGKSLYRTMDGGRHWTEVTTIGFYASEPKNGLPGSGYIAGLDFLNAKVGWLAETRGFTYITMDGGHTWKGLGDYRDAPLRELHFLDSKRGYAVYRNALLTTQDGGSTWKQIYPGVWPSLFTLTRFFNSYDGVSAGTLVEPGAILRTTDGGHMWLHIGSVPGGGRIIDLSFPDQQHGWVITESFSGTDIQRTIYRTTDGGLTWQTVNRSKEQKNLYAWLSFVDDNTGFVGSGWGHLFVTHDGGRTLQVVDDKDSDSANFQFINSNVGWKTMDHHFYATTDAGQTWRMVPLDYLAVGFDMVSGDTVWAIAKRTLDSPPVLLSTSNGGQAWTLHDLENINPAGVVFADAEHGWLVDDHENYYHTGDGGQTWTQVDLLAH